MIIPSLLSLVSFLVLIFFQAQGVYGGDSGDLVTAAFVGGVAHPPGYPLYTLLGWLLSHIPVLTPAWRVGLLSSVPHAMSLGIVYWLVTRLTKYRFAGFLAAFTLLGNYLFFLYSITAEVFALFDFFVVVLLLFVIVYQQTGKERYALLMLFVLGLSLTHHQLILFLTPALLYLLWSSRDKKITKISVRAWMIRVSVFVFGLAPCLYIFFAARSGPIINWNYATTIPNFIRLVTRYDYGTFKSGAFFGQHIVERLVGVRAYGRFVVLDFTWIGIVLAILGSWWMYKNYTKIFISFLLAFVFLGPGFFFYASFPLVNRFTLGTYERFLLPTYLLLSICIGCGFYALIRLWESIVVGRFTVFAGIARFGFYIIVLLYPLSHVWINTQRFWGLSVDRTADNLGKDILATVPQGGILLMSHDTPLFITQYVRFALKERSDVILLHQSIMESDYYPLVVAKTYPSIALPKIGEANFLKEFALLHVGRTPIFSNNPFGVNENWLWIPKGLLYQLVPVNEAPSADALIQENGQLWSLYHNPTTGILSRFNHLMLSDVRDEYEGSRIALGKTLLRAERPADAKEQFEQAVLLGSEMQMKDAYMYLGLSELFLKHCDSAIAAFGEAKKVSMVPDNTLTLYESVTYRDCLGDALKAKELYDAYTTGQSQNETPIEQ